jgi:molecular chaperone HscB
MKYYEALGLERRLALDSDDLKKRFYERSRQWHPDRFGRASAIERQQALDTTALLNDAFRTLKDPPARAEYFLESSGIPPSKNPPPELLEEVFELNMALEELREGDASVRGQLESARERFSDMLSRSGQELVTLFDKFDQTQGHDVLQEVRQVLDRRRYISNLLRDVEKELNVQLSN